MQGPAGLSEVLTFLLSYGKTTDGVSFMTQDA